MKLTWYGHDAFLLEGPPNILIDPFFSNNGLAPEGAMESMKCDFIVLTHAHGDHLGDALTIGKRCGATVIATHEVATYCNQKAGLDMEGMNTGGTIEVTDGQGNKARVTLVPAHHSCSIMNDEGQFIPGGVAVGAIVEMDNQAVYHLGDTALLRDFKTIGEFWDIDVALIPIGDRFTMGLRSATIAAGWIKPKRVIPMHYNTFPIIPADPQAYAMGVKDAYDIPVEVLKPGESTKI